LAEAAEFEVLCLEVDEMFEVRVHRGRDEGFGIR
jgi:hypothetical protein